MLVGNFKDNAHQYQDFAVWDIENMNAFLHGNGAIAEIFKADYKMSVDEFDARRSEIPKTNMEIMEEVLDQIGDKHFFIFTYHDDKHWQLVQMQDEKVMNFGIDIANVIEKDRVYILLMEKKAEYNKLQI